MPVSAAVALRVPLAVAAARLRGIPGQRAGEVVHVSSIVLEIDANGERDEVLRGSTRDARAAFDVTFARAARAIR